MIDGFAYPAKAIRDSMLFFPGGLHSLALIDHAFSYAVVRTAVPHEVALTYLFRLVNLSPMNRVKDTHSPAVLFGSSWYGPLLLPGCTIVYVFNFSVVGSTWLELVVCFGGRVFSSSTPRWMDVRYGTT